MGITLLIILFAFILYFNRAPNRNIPVGNIIVSPANGDIIHIESVDSNSVSFFKGDIENVLDIHKITPPYNVIVIELDLKDVHVQRAPIDGSIVYKEYFPGKHRNALSSPNVERLANVNEKNLIVFQNESIAVGVSQVAGITARRVQSFVETGDILKKGEVYGRIVLGSQVVVILPKSVKLNVEVGQTLIDGESIIGSY